MNNSRSEVKSTCPRLTQLGTQSAVRSVFALLGFAVFVFLAALFLIALFAGMILFVEHAIVVGIEFGEFLLGLVRVFGGGDELCFGDVTIAIGILFLPVFGGFLFRFLRAFFLGIDGLGGEEQGENRQQGNGSFHIGLLSGRSVEPDIAEKVAAMVKKILRQAVVLYSFPPTLIGPVRPF